MKKIFLGIMLSLLLGGAGCVPQEPIVQSPIRNATTAQKIEEPAENTFTVQGLTFTLPKNLKVEQIENNSKESKVTILTDDKPYTVHLILHVKPETQDFYKENSDYNEPNEKTIIPNGEIFRVIGAAGAYAWDGIKIDGKLYSLGWGIESTERAPKDVDSPTMPTSNVNVRDIEKTVRVAK